MRTTSGSSEAVEDMRTNLPAVMWRSGNGPGYGRESRMPRRTQAIMGEAAGTLVAHPEEALR